MKKNESTERGLPLLFQKIRLPVMDTEKIGKIIKALRKEKNMSQKDLAEKINVSSKTVSKWETGKGCPDITLLSKLSSALDLDTNMLLDGEIRKNRTDTGKMKSIRFFICPECGNIISSTSSSSIFCCGRKLKEAERKTVDECHDAKTEIIGDEIIVSLDHEMTKSHHINFAALISDDTILLKHLYAESDAIVRLPVISRRATLLLHCSEDGLFEKKIRLF